MKRLPPLGALALALTIVLPFMVAPGQSRAADDQLRGVVELFTSQGCSSCPPADRFLAELAQEPDILALAWHVDYWNYLGWEDTFSKAAFTARQRAYSATFERPAVYTPQAIVNGRAHVVGSHGPQIRDLIQRYAEDGNGGLPVALSVKRDGDGHTISVIDCPREATLRLVSYQPKASVDIQRGENRGKTIVYHNIVRDMRELGATQAGALTVVVADDPSAEAGLARAVLLQAVAKDGGPGPILGAARLR